MRKIPFMDAYYLMVESRRTPMHVAAMSLFTLPKGVKEAEFLASLGGLLNDNYEVRRPFSERLKTGRLGAAGKMYWVNDHELDMDYHVRHSALPQPGGYKELFTLVSRLHGSLLDRSRPLWEFHLIEGLQNRQFATYFKAHHSAIDGVGAMKVINSMYSSDPDTKAHCSPLSQQAYLEYQKQRESSQRKRPAQEHSEQDIKGAFSALQEQLGSTVNVGSALGDLAGVWLKRNRDISVPFHQIPKLSWASQIRGARRFVAQSWPLERIRAVGKAVDGTVNDAVLGMVAGALRKNLEMLGETPKHTLKGMAPVSIRTGDKASSSNAIGMVIVDLHTNVEDPAQRLFLIKDSMDASKSQLSNMNSNEIEIYSGLTHGPQLITQLAGIGNRFPAYNTIISNVPGPQEPRYWNGAKLEGLYPAGIPIDGCPINFTLLGNGDNLDFGIVACRKSMPHIQRIIDYLEDSLAELEDAVGV